MGTNLLSEFRGRCDDYCRFVYLFASTCVCAKRNGDGVCWANGAHVRDTVEHVKWRTYMHSKHASRCARVCVCVVVVWFHHPSGAGRGYVMA